MNIAIAFIMAATICNAQSITFTVDKGLTAPKGHLKYAKDDAQTYTHIIDMATQGRAEGHSFVASSFPDEKVFTQDNAVLYELLLKAFAEHRPVVLTPDDIWLMICQVFSDHINRNAEELRDLLVDFDGKKTLSVRSGEDLLAGNADWAGIINSFASQIDANTKGDFARTMVADFSTTGVTERVVSQITLMDAAKSYFNYEVIYMVCGIPSITLTGTPDDWKSIRERAQRMKEYGLGWWIDKLDPILVQFVDASQGEVDTDFWQDIVMKKRPGQLRGPSCMPNGNGPTTIDGWFLTFFPFDNNGRTPDTIKMGHSIPSKNVIVPFQYKIVDPAGNVLKETPMELVSGFMGIQEDTTTFTLSTKLGWMAGIRPADKDDEGDERSFEPVRLKSRGMAPAKPAVSESAKPAEDAEDAKDAVYYPIVLVNGVELEDGLRRINPEKVESIEVVKDKSVIEKYGKRAKGGVILVKTR